MSRRRAHWTTLLTLLAVLAAASGFAAGAETALGAFEHVQLPPSAHADLLGPITEDGRTGWDCRPERAAQAAAAEAAELPHSDR